MAPSGVDLAYPFVCPRSQQAATGGSREDRCHVQFVNVTTIKLVGVVLEVMAGFDPSSSVRQSTQCFEHQQSPY